MFHRIVTIVLLGCMFAGGFDGASASSVDKSQVAAPPSEAPLSVEQYCSAPRWEFIRNGVTNHDESGSIELPFGWLPARLPDQPKIGISSEQARLRPSGLTLLCERALQMRSGVLKS